MSRVDGASPSALPPLFPRKEHDPPGAGRVWVPAFGVLGSRGSALHPGLHPQLWTGEANSKTPAGFPTRGVWTVRDFFTPVFFASNN